MEPLTHLKKKCCNAHSLMLQTDMNFWTALWYWVPCGKCKIVGYKKQGDNKVYPERKNGTEDSTSQYSWLQSVHFQNSRFRLNRHEGMTWKPLEACMASSSVSGFWMKLPLHFVHLDISRSSEIFNWKVSITFNKLNNLISSLQSIISFLLAQFINRNTREKQLSPLSTSRVTLLGDTATKPNTAMGMSPPPPSSLLQLPLVRAVAAHPSTFSPLGSLLNWASSMWGVGTSRCSCGVLVNLCSRAGSPGPAVVPLKCGRWVLVANLAIKDAGAYLGGRRHRLLVCFVFFLLYSLVNEIFEVSCVLR
jgi:hypothetical protein